MEDEENICLDLFGQQVPTNVEKFLLDGITHASKTKIDLFFGNHPINLIKTNIDLILNNDYLVCEKSDGVRVILICAINKIFLYDRNNKIYEVKRMGFKTTSFYIFDAEIYLNTKTNSYILAIFDCLFFSNNNITHKNLYTRLNACKDFVVDKLPQKLFNIDDSNNSKYKILKIEYKRMYKSYVFKEILKDIVNLNHKNDGLIFTPVAEPYIFYERTKILKWKPSELQTIDFFIETSHIKGRYDLKCIFYDRQLYYTNSKEYNKKKFDYKNQYKYVTVAEWLSEDTETDYSLKIGEFRWNKNKLMYDRDGVTYEGGWELYKIRTDKVEPNNIKIFLSQCSGFENLLTEIELNELQQQMRENFKQREMAVSNNKKQKTL